MPSAWSNGPRTKMETYYSGVVGRSIALIRAHWGWSQRTCEQKLRLLGVGIKNLSVIERATPFSQVPPVLTIDQLIACAKIFRISPEWLLTEHSDKIDLGEFIILDREELIPYPKNYYARVVGDNAREVRIKNGWSIKQLAEKVEALGTRLKSNRLSVIEIGSTNSSITVDQFMALVRALKTTPDRLLTESRVMVLVLLLKGQDEIQVGQIPEATSTFLERLYQEELVGKFKRNKNDYYLLTPLGITEAQEAHKRMEQRGIHLIS
jgi:transcriptional regulator with XRE-family HTH domain